MLAVMKPPVMEVVEEIPFEFMQVELKPFREGDTVNPRGYLFPAVQ